VSNIMHDTERDEDEEAVLLQNVLFAASSGVG
jgi:hypothetical protein